MERAAQDLRQVEKALMEEEASRGAYMATEDDAVLERLESSRDRLR